MHASAPQLDDVISEHTNIYFLKIALTKYRNCSMTNLIDKTL